MRSRRTRSKLLTEPPASATGDIAFNLIVFFLVCASVQPNQGREQEIPKSEEKPKQQQSENIEVMLTRTTASINGTVVLLENFPARLRELLKSKTRDEDRVVVVKQKPEVEYHHYIRVQDMIEKAGGIIAFQIEEERTVITP